MSSSSTDPADRGAAVVGMRPVCEMQFADFISCGFDQLVNVAGKMYYRQELPVPITVRSVPSRAMRAVSGVSYVPDGTSPLMRR